MLTREPESKDAVWVTALFLSKGKRAVSFLLFTLLLVMVGTGAVQAGDLQWAWVEGSATLNQDGTYGVQGVPHEDNIPGGRYDATSWMGNSGALWLFGGLGYTISGAEGSLNDLWRYDPTTGNWTWMKGSTSTYQTGSYGTIGVENETNTPGGRMECVSWTDNSGVLWLFGGYGPDSTSTSGQLNELWKYDPATGNWTWMKGANTCNASGTYGSIGVAHEGNTPGSRSQAVSWKDDTGVLWLFGGKGYDAVGSYGYLNDLWKYDPATGNWTWMKGSNTKDPTGFYGARGLEASNNTPGGIEDAVAWVDNSGNFWLFGGRGPDSAGDVGFLCALWRYRPSTGNWTWYRGLSTRDQEGEYGIQEQESHLYYPGGRITAVSGRDGDMLWLFGGFGYDNNSGEGRLNDLWRFNLSTSNWSWRKGHYLVNQSATFGTKGIPHDNNTPGAVEGPVSWTDASGNLWVFGGSGKAGGSSTGNLQDLWRFGMVYNLNFQTDGTAGASLSGGTSQKIFQGDDATSVTAVPPAGYHFVDWSQTTGSGWDSATSNPLTVTSVTEDISLTANFAPNQYTLTYIEGANGSITGTTPQTVDHGNNGSTVTAVADTGYDFYQWSDAATDNPRWDKNVTGNISVTAEFVITTPTAPTNPGATSISSNSITWTWAENAAVETAYLLYSGKGANAPSILSQTLATDVDSFTTSGLSVNTQYAFQVAARNERGADLADSTKSVNYTTWTLAATPVAPNVSNPTINSLDVAIGPGDGNPTSHTLYAISLLPALGDDSWVQDDGSLSSTTFWQTADDWGTVSVSGLADSQAYTFKVRARNGAGIETADGPGVEGTTLPPQPAPPTNPGTTAITSNSITWTWTDNSDNETGFHVYLGTGTTTSSLADLVAADTTQYTSSGLAVNSRHAFQVSAVNLGGESAKTTLITTWTLALVPVAPVLTNPDSETITLSMGMGDDNPTSTTYAVMCETEGQYVRTDGSLGAGAEWQTAADWADTVVSGLSPSETYTFKVKARNGGQVETDFGPSASLQTSQGTPAAAEGRWSLFE